MDRIYFFYKTERAFYKMHLLPLAVLVRAFMRIIFACDIPYKAQIGKGTQFPHDALGVVFHADVKIGENCRISQNVTVGGRRSNGVDLISPPVVGDNVIIGTNAVVLGNIKVGNNATIGAGAVVLKDVPENAVVAGVPAKIIRLNGERYDGE